MSSASSAASSYRKVPLICKLILIYDLIPCCCHMLPFMRPHFTAHEGQYLETRPLTYTDYLRQDSP